MNASLFLALRYLKPQRSFVSIITVLAILGPIIGVAVLVIVIAVMEGFQRDIRDRIFDVQSHAQIRSLRYDRPYIADPGPMLDVLRAAGLRATPVVEGPALLQSRYKITPKAVKGLAPTVPGDEPSPFFTKLIEGSDDLRSGKVPLGDDEALIGKELAQEFGLRVGDKLVIHPTGKLQKRIKINPTGQVEAVDSEDVYVPEEVTVVGIFSYGMYDVDANLAILSLDKADTVFDLPWGAAQSVQIWCDDPYKLDGLFDVVAANKDLFNGYQTITWMQMNADYFAVLESEKSMQFFILIIIMVVAGFSIMATLITVVVQKTREIGVLKALGTNPLAILALFILQGGIVGLIGVTFGTGLGLLIIRFRNQIAALLKAWTGWEIFPAQFYQLPEIPAHVVTGDVARIMISAFVICVLAAVLPAAYAASMKPTDALRTEA